MYKDYFHMSEENNHRWLSGLHKFHKCNVRF